MRAWLTVLATMTWAATVAGSIAAQEVVAPRDEATSMSDRPGTVREIRLGLVCYGGISLAIYMHGNTKEFHRLVLASRALEEDAGRGFSPDSRERGEAGKGLPDTAGYYYDLLQAQWARERVRTRIVIDVISGTSAGGINGVILAKALAEDLSQDALRELWFKRAGIQRLLAWPPLLRYPPLKGDAIYLWVRDAVDEMDRTAKSRPPYSKGTLVPAGHPLDLYVTTTDYSGHPQHVLVGNPATILEKRHREVMHFHYDDKPNSLHRTPGFDSYWNPALAFAARATSSFPGAFPPFSLNVVAKHKRPGEVDEAGIASALFRDYELEQGSARATYFMDGGVIDNYPFGHAVREIVSRLSDHEIRRVLVYLQPDPGKPPHPPEGGRPGWFATIWAGLATVNGYEPILDDLLEVQAHNDKVTRLRNIVSEEEAKGREELKSPTRAPLTGAASVALKVAPILRRATEISEDRRLKTPEAPAPTTESILEFTELRRTIENQAAEEAALVHRGYTELRVYSVIEQIADLIDKRCRFPQESAHATIVREVVHRWAERNSLIGRATDPNLQQAFLEDLDLGYLRRQLRFVSDWLNAQYLKPESDTTRRAFPPPSRKDLDLAKQALSKKIAFLSALIGGEVPDDGDTAGTAETQQILRGWQGIEELFCSIEPWKAPAFERLAPEIAESKNEQFSAWRQTIGAYMRGKQDRIRADLFTDFEQITRSWDPVPRQEVLTRYMGFPYWDRLLYPFTAFSGIGELREIEVYRVSPDDATTLAAGDAAAKLKGVTVGHFGAFFHRASRENDYLWGRLDAIERITDLLAGPRGDEPTGEIDKKLLKSAFLAALEEESKSGLVNTRLLAEFRAKVERR